MDEMKVGPSSSLKQGAHKLLVFCLLEGKAQSKLNLPVRADPNCLTDRRAQLSE
jgi:hypothetical protein